MWSKTQINQKRMTCQNPRHETQNWTTNKRKQKKIQPKNKKKQEHSEHISRQNEIATYHL